jgi:hypothetical protein
MVVNGAEPQTTLSCQTKTKVLHHCGDKFDVFTAVNGEFCNAAPLSSSRRFEGTCRLNIQRYNVLNECHIGSVASIYVSNLTKNRKAENSIVVY